MPKSENTITTTIRLPDAEHQRLRAAADARGESVTTLIRRALEKELDHLATRCPNCNRVLSPAGECVFCKKWRETE